MFLSYAGGFAETVADLADYERAGLDIVFVPEAYSFDAVSQLGFIAAKTERVQIASGIFQLYSRTPALTAMTAAGLDYVSGGRFTLGLGASGPQVIEGWHGVPYDAPLGRIDVIAHAALAIGDDSDIMRLRDLGRPQLALYIGGMGARGRNFYNDLARRLGYETEAKAIQDAYLDGRKAEAEALVPAELVERTSLIGPESYVAERIAAYREAGVTTLNVTPLAPTLEARIRLIEQARALADAAG